MLESESNILNLNWKKLGNNNLFVFLTDEQSFPIAKLSINCPEYSLREGEFVLKNYSENIEISKHLINDGIIELTGKNVKIGRNLVPICRINKE